MRLAFSRPTNGPAEQRALFENYRPLGYAGLQLKAGQYRPYLADPDAFRAQWGEYPGGASALIAGGSLDDAGVVALRDLCQFASALGSERIVFVHSLPRQEVTDDDIRRFARILSELGREARQRGVALSLHHHHNQPVMHRRDIALFFETAAAGAVGLTVDTAHLVKSGIMDIAGVIREFRSVIDNFHLKDFAAGKWRVLGHGDIDFSPVFSAIDEIGYDGWLCADEESGGDLVGGMRACYQFMAQGIRQR